MNLGMANQAFFDTLLAQHAEQGRVPTEAARETFEMQIPLYVDQLSMLPGVQRECAFITRVPEDGSIIVMWADGHRSLTLEVLPYGASRTFSEGIR